MKQFDLLFYKGNSVISRLIQLFSKSKYSHVAMIIDNECFHLLEIDSKFPVSIKHHHYMNEKYDLFELSVTLNERQKEEVLNFIRNNISCKYDWIYIISRALNIIFGTKIKNIRNRYNCDELICEAFKVASIELISDNVKLTPQVLSESEFLRKIIKN